jgi:hypothetical protein
MQKNEAEWALGGAPNVDGFYLVRCMSEAIAAK